jgi:hypothetical protein
MRAFNSKKLSCLIFNEIRIKNSEKNTVILSFLKRKSERDFANVFETLFTVHDHF